MKVYGVMGWKNSGKTGLVERLVAEITARGYSVSTIKHAHHDVDLDQPGKDTWRHRQAGAREVVMASPSRFAVMHELRGAAEPSLADLLARMAPVDLVLVEGYKRDSHPKIEVLRAETGQPLLQPGDPTVRAVASNADLPALPVPHFDLDDTLGIADFVLNDSGLAGTDGQFDTVVIVDWSARSTLSPARQSADSIWVGVVREGTEETIYCRGRAHAETVLVDLFQTEAAAGRRVLAGFDFPFGYPQGFAAALTGQPAALALWDWLDNAVQDDAQNRNNRFQLADSINMRFPGIGPFWGRPSTLALANLPEKGSLRADHGLPERRLVETRIKSAQPVWKLYTTGSVGSQALLGLPVVNRLRNRFGAAVWPFEPAKGGLVLAEIYPSLIDAAVRAAAGPIKDEVQVRLLARAFHRLAVTGGLTALLDDVPDWPGRAAEGWILGAGHAARLMEALDE